jgi:protein gp37
MGKEGWGDAPRILTVGPWREVRKWNRDAREAGERRRVFCASLADVFENNVEPMVDFHGRTLHVNGQEFSSDPAHRAHGAVVLDDVRRRLWGVIRQCDSLDFLLLTKRPENIRWMLPDDLKGRHNVWLGTTVESNKYLWRLNELLAVPAAVHFVSAEPQLEEIDFRPWLEWSTYYGPVWIDWIITGGESKQGADHEPRPYNVAWARSIVQQCREAHIPCFIKQLGSRPVVDLVGPSRVVECGRNLSTPVVRTFDVDLKHPKGGDPQEWPKDLRVREVPETGDQP